jgi:hypothetical protein
VKTLLALDIPESKLLPESLLGCSRHAIAVATKRVRGLLSHPSEVLAHLDAERGLAPDLIVVSTDSAPPAEADMRCWGLGWRVGRNLDTSWVHLAIEEGRVASATWCQVGPDDVRVTRCFGKDEPTSSQLRLSDFLTASSTDVLVVRRNGTRIPRLRDQELPTTDRLVRLWHGSRVQGLKRLVPPAGGRLWVSGSKAFAVSFGASPYSNQGFFHGVDRVSEDFPQVYLAIPRDREDVLHRPCSLYLVEAEVAQLREEGVPGFEFILRSEVPVVTEQHFGTVAEALAAFDITTICLGTAKANDTLAQRCRPHRQGLEGWLGLPLDVALRIPAFAWRIRLWFVARGLEPFAEGDLPWLARIIERAWLPWVAGTRAGGSALPEHGYHSLAHLLEVAQLGAWLALREGVNPIPVALFGLLHDATRMDDGPESGHAEAAAALFDLMQASDIRYLLLPRDAERVRAAIAGHAYGERSQDPLVGVCWDADRARLAWERGVSPRFFSTRSGLQLAHAGPNREW